METWNFKVKSNPQEIIKKLHSALGSGDGFVFNMDHDNNDSVTFKVRKRVIYPFQILLDNKIVVNGKILKTDTENETDVEISFVHHFFTIVYISMFIGLGLLAIILGISSSVSMSITGGLLIAVGIVFWIDVQRKSKRYIQNYKTLISKTLEF
ncbi:DUF423 domain-containing protein [Marinilabiliaceae bacterium JC017]|nr:DUF423 domain-containing protein [Marinilabiliaceae bacterium JC017]